MQNPPIDAHSESAGPMHEPRIWAGADASQRSPLVHAVFGTAQYDSVPAETHAP